jgi:hypothetical protein
MRNGVGLSAAADRDCFNPKLSIASANIALVRVPVLIAREIFSKL